MSETIYEIQNLHLSYKDMANKRIFKAAPEVEVLKGLTFNIAKEGVVRNNYDSGAANDVRGENSKTSVVKNNYDGGSAIDVRGLQDWCFRHPWKSPHQAWMGWRSASQE